ncbi:MAG TPA: GEVED domain-containing protein, partial [Bacteroidia bacterium]|nr:GEVED domain-containing protein [Bacteroidia bacterium]HNU34583.1 GEVED domain-containing protein [Bacteroidia bacterium]
WLGGSYTNNDYVRSTFMNGVPAYPVIASAEPNNNYGPPCCSVGPVVPPVYKSYFSNHPPDYELFSPDSPGRTTTLRVALATTATTVSGNNVITVPSTTNIAVGDYIRIPAHAAGVYTWNTCAAPAVVTAILSGTTIQVFPAPTTSLTNTTAYFGGYKIDIQCGTWFSSNYVAAWIDFDKAAGFTNTSWVTGGEKISQSGNLSSLGTHTCYFQVPSTATIGKNTLRVREIYATSNCDPCASATYGETEDYSINIIGFCGIPGWKTWLGYTDDWNTASNWCPAGVPTAVQNVRIPGSGAVGYTRPVIKAGVNAFCNKLRIEGSDTLYIDAYQNGGLTASDSIYIQAPQGMIKVISSYNATAVMGIGTLYNSNATPLKGGIRYHKMQITYTQAELLARGLVAGDVITQVVIPITTLGVGTHTFNPLQIRYYYTNPFFCFASANPTLAPVVTAGGTVFSGSFGPVVVGDNPVTLAPTFTWNGSANNLIIEICYALPASGTATERIEQTQTLGCRSVAYWGDLTNTTPGCALPGTGAPRNSYDQRPNLKFVFNRPYSKVPIALAGHWGNNGTFIPGFSRVTFNGINPQNIAGTSNTNFYDLTINNSHASGVTQVTAATLSGDTLNLINGPFRLNGNTFTHKNSLPTSVIRTNGWLQSESLPPAYGRFLWEMGSNTSPHVFPFGLGSGAANYLPFTFTPTAGSAVTVDMATYLTIPANTPLPTGVPAIQNFYTGGDNSPNMVDRFWQIDLGGTGTTGDYLFTYRSAEIAANGNTNPRAQRWQTSTSKWTDPTTFAAQSNPTANQVLVPNQSITGAWAISIQAQPLPIELLAFTAKKEKDRVKLLWSTASEINNDYFTIERTQNQNEFSFIDKVDSRGPSSNILEYYTYDYRPLNGLQYYRLMQTDNDGTSTYSKLVPVTFGKENFEIVTVSSPNEESRNILFNYDNDGEVGIRVVDIMGKTVYEKLNFKTIDGINQFDLSVANLTTGVFTIFIFDETRKVSRKIIF